MRLVTRYHPLLVSLHWLLAAVIIGMLIIGFGWLAMSADSDPQKIAVLRWHMAGGMLILALMLVRFVVRIVTTHPAAASTGSRVLDRFAPVVHYSFYVLILLMAGTGMATALLARLNEIVFQGTGEALPANLAAYPTMVAHGWMALVLAGFIALHLIVALYHQLVRRDGPFARMSLTRRMRQQLLPAE